MPELAFALRKDRVWISKLNCSMPYDNYTRTAALESHSSFKHSNKTKCFFLDLKCSP